MVSSKVATSKVNLKGLPIMLSASLPPEMERTARGQDAFNVVVSVAGGILSAGGTLIFGGHPSITPLVHRLVLSGGSVLAGQSIVLFQAAAFKDDAPVEVNDSTVFNEVCWIGSPGASDKESVAADLEEMRQAMVERARAAVFAGGKQKDFIGRLPGIRDEYQRFTQRHPNGPAYLLGLLDGETRNIISELERIGQREPNSLDSTELELLHHTDSIDLACSLILADLQRYAS
jgi:hypothetical protein